MGRSDLFFIYLKLISQMVNSSCFTEYTIIVSNSLDNKDLKNFKQHYCMFLYTRIFIYWYWIYDVIQKYIHVYCYDKYILFHFSFFWGWLSDKFGRRPIILITVFLNGFFSLAFGFPMAVITRFLTGLANGNNIFQ